MGMPCHDAVGLGLAWLGNWAGQDRMQERTPGLNPFLCNLCWSRQLGVSWEIGSRRG